MSKISLSSRESKILGLTVCLLLAAAGYRLMFLPLKGMAASFKKEILAARRTLKANQKTIAQAGDLQKKYQGQWEEFQQDGSDEQVMSLMISEISRAAAQAQVPVADLKPGRPRRVDFYNIFSVALTTEGSLKDVMGFIYALQKLPRPIQVDELRLEKMPSAKTELRCTLTLSRILIP